MLLSTDDIKYVWYKSVMFCGSYESRPVYFSANMHI